MSLSGQPLICGNILKIPRTIHNGELYIAHTGKHEKSVHKNVPVERRYTTRITLKQYSQCDKNMENPPRMTQRSPSCS